MTSEGDEVIAGSDSSSMEALHGSRTDECVTAFHCQNHQVVNVNQGHASLAPNYHPWSSSTGPATVSWNFHRTDNNPNESGPPTSSGYHYDPQKEVAASGDGQGGVSCASHASTPSNTAVANVTQDYAGYALYSNSSSSYGYSKADYQSYYYDYQQPASESSQQAGANQNSGAAYQPLNSFQNTGSYNSHASYSSTYYNAGDHQTAGYQNSSYSNQTNMWNDGNYGSYPHHLYSNYTSSDTNSAQSSNTVAPNTLHYQQQYNQWSYYYNQSVPSFSCAPGTEKTSVPTVSSAGCLIPGGGGYSYTSNQPPPPGTTSWRTDSGSSGLPSLQEKRDVTAYNSNGSWQAGALGFQNPNANQVTSYFQKPLDSNPFPYGNHEDQQKALYSQSPTLQLSSTNPTSENIQAPLQAVAVPDVRRVSKVQIPTNPRIASNLALVKTDKERSTTNAATKPAYISISVPMPSNDLSSHEDAEAIIKGTFPPSLRAYVERTFARCKDDSQRSANQTVMKEIITKASADGSLFTKNWDMEPLFPLPNNDINMADQNNSAPTLSKYRRSPSRRSKSRWEPVADEKSVEKLPSINNKLTKDFSWDSKGTERETDSRNRENRDNGWKGLKFITSLQQTPLSKFTQRPVKKPRFGDSLNVIENGDASSDSDKEQELTKYYSSAIALANSPEERKRREHRFKRFEKGQESQVEIKQLRPKVAGAGNIYMRRASAMLLARSSDDGCSRVVEDIDWDALTVKGTCQEVEKRYLRLTSAPDPGSVRPEDVLEKALHMVQNSEKNYLYKCDQLKSIRQDLTVQRIQNELTVKVYETHARLALEAGDLPEYNQCQSQLKRLYAEGIKGCHLEFSAYNLLYVCLNSNNKRDLLSSMTRLSDETKDYEAVKHALAVRSAVSSGNYILFFRLYKAAPNLNTCLMDLYVEKMRFEAVKCMSKSYRPAVPITYIARVLGFFRAIPVKDSEDKDTDGSEDCEEWLKAHGAVLTVDSSGELQMDTKVSSSSLYMPEPEDTVAHGDASLAVDDFLTRTS